MYIPSIGDRVEVTSDPIYTGYAATVESVESVCAWIVFDHCKELGSFPYYFSELKKM